MNGKVYTLRDLEDLCEVAQREYEDGWWGIVVPEYLYDAIKMNTEEGNRFARLFAINVIINDDVVRKNGGHCMFVDKEFGRALLDGYTMPYELYEEYVKWVTTPWTE